MALRWCLNLIGMQIKLHQWKLRPLQNHWSWLLSFFIQADSLQLMKKITAAKDHISQHNARKL
ncbi:hypothetical protein LINPERPRIM_LOCUS23764, partial [Linum perenne]